MRVILLTNIPAPYRESINEQLSEKLERDFAVAYFAKIESNRKWKFSFADYNRIFLHSVRASIFGKDIYLYSNISTILQNRNCSVLILCTLSLPAIFAFLFAKLKKIKIIAMSDGTLDSEKGLTSFHRLIRKVLYPRMDAYIGASNKSIDLFKHYGAPGQKCFIAPLCADVEFYSSSVIPIESRDFDVILCGQFIQRKRFDFAIAVINLLRERIGRVKVKLVGDGPLKDQILLRLDELKIDYKYAGHVDSNKMPAEFASAKLFLFPTDNDPWGVVANEACAVGTPVITCPNAGAADELIIDGFNGHVLPLDTKRWADYAYNILSNPDLLRKFSENALSMGDRFNYSVAAERMYEAVQRALQG